MIAPQDDQLSVLIKTVVWPLLNSLLGLSVMGWMFRQSGRVDVMYQYLFGVKGATNGGTSARLTTVEKELKETRSEAIESPAGRELLAAMEELRKALARASEATDLVKKEINDKLVSMDSRIENLETHFSKRR